MGLRGGRGRHSLRLPERHDILRRGPGRAEGAGHGGEQPARPDRIRTWREAPRSHRQQLVGSDRILPLLRGRPDGLIGGGKPVLELPRAPPREEPEHGMVIRVLALSDGGPHGRPTPLGREDLRSDVQHDRPLAVHPRWVHVDDRAGRRVHGKERGGEAGRQLNGSPPHSLDKPHLGHADAVPQVLRDMGSRGGLDGGELARVHLHRDLGLRQARAPLRQGRRPAHTVHGG